MMRDSTNIPPPQPMPVRATEYANAFSLTTFINAYYQIRDCLAYRPKSVLIVGVGVGLEAIILREKFSVGVVTIDIDPNFGSDYSGSVHDMRQFGDGQFDVCIASHVLEHLAFAYFEASLAEIARVARHALIYLPYGLRHMELKLIRAQREKEYALRFSLPSFRSIDGNTPLLCDNQHYWECGYRNFEPWRIRSIIEKFFTLDRMYHNHDWKFSLNFCVTSRRHGKPTGS
jgi:hypothetical protein